MQSSKWFIQPHHFLGVRRGVITFFSIPRFCLSHRSARNLRVLAVKGCSLPWCFLLFMTLVVAGPMKSRFVIFIVVIVSMGMRTEYLLSSANKPSKPDEVGGSGNAWPGYVKARTTGRALWRKRKLEIWLFEGTKIELLGELCRLQGPQRRTTNGFSKE